MNHGKSKNGEVIITLTVSENQIVVLSVVGNYSIHWGDDNTLKSDAQLTDHGNNHTNTLTCQHKYENAGFYTIQIIGEINDISIKNTPLERISIKKCTRLNSIHVVNCELQELNICNGQKLVYLNCPCNNLKRLNLGTCKDLISLNCVSNKLTTLNLKRNYKLFRLQCSNNRLKRIMLDSSKISHLDCCYNNLTARELENIFQDITRYGNVGEIDYALNPGTAIANTRDLKLNYWEILNRVMENFAQRILDEKKSRFNQVL